MSRHTVARFLAILIALAAPLAAIGQEEKIANATALIGAPVKSVDGEDLGRLRDLVLDLNDQRVRYAIMERQGRLLRYSIVQLDPAPEGKHVVLYMSKERLDGSPAMDPAWQGYGLVRASELLGRSVRDARGSRIGELADVVIDWSDGRVRHAVVRASSGAERSEHVPLGAFSIQHEHLVLER